MNYESNENRIQRLDKQVAGLIPAIIKVAAANNKNHEIHSNFSMLLMDEVFKLWNSHWVSLRVVIEALPNLSKPSKKALFDLIVEKQEECAAVRDSLAEAQKVMAANAIIRTEDLFGPAQQWPSHNPPPPPAS